MATKPTTDAIKAALTTALAWFTVMADGTARPAVLVTATGRINSDDSANSPARLAWRCNGARIPLVGMLAALQRGWDAAPKTWPILRDVAPSTLVAEGKALYGLDDEHPAVSWDGVADQSDRAIISALFRAVQPDVSAPFEVIAAALTPAPEGEKGSKLSAQERELVNAIMNLSETNPARAALMAELSAEGLAEVERRTKAKTEKAARREEAKAKADAEKVETDNADAEKPQAPAKPKATPKK